MVKLDLPREITLKLLTGKEGYLKITSPDVPGFYICGTDHDAVFGDLPEVLADLIEHNGLTPV